MGVRTRGEVAARLVARGWAAETPAAIILGASHAGSTRWLGTVGTLAEAVFDTDFAGIVVVGAVVELANQIANDYAGIPARAVRTS
jgi:uroporphyrin-III C-methyltransferase/precorrin-2 dehydrogenase/sirohydrochlorin ferrochelatase